MPFEKKKSRQRWAVGFELTISKKNMVHCQDQVYLTTRPLNWCTMRTENIYLNSISKDWGICRQLIVSKVLNNRLVPHFVENKQLMNHKITLLCCLMTITFEISS